MDLKKFNSGVKKFVSGTVALTLSATTVLPSASVFAEKAEQKYPYAMFASSDKDGAISVSTAYSSGINGNIATNGTIATNGSFNFNGSKKEHAKEEMIYISKKLSHTYFNTDDVKRFDSDLSFEDVNINIDDPWEVQGSLDLTGNIDLNNGIKALSDINIDGNVKNSHDSVIFSEEGDINIDTTNVSFTGLIYAPHGDINIDVDNLNLNSAVIIGETISIDCKNANINYGNNVAEKIGNESDFETTLYAFASYNKENNSIEIKWNSNYEPENYEIWASDDNKKYNSVSVVSNANSYSYIITDDFEKKYFKVSMIDSYGDKIESVPFIVTKTDKGYSVDFLDSDNDGLADIFENMFGTNKNKPDTDNDGLTDYQEIYITGTDPLKYDSVKKGISDADSDLDGDGLSNAKEIELGTDPKKSDTDDDSLSDGDEISKYKTDPLKKDTDDDGLEDDDEIYFKTDPKNPDTNRNGVKDGNEYFNQEINNNCFDKDLFDNNLAIPSLSNVIAKGNASKDAEISEYNGYLKGDERVYVGKVIEIKDTDIKSGKLSFTLDKSYNLNEYTLEGHTTNGLLICYNDGNTTTPLATNFDAENKTLSADISSDGIYFVLDVMSWIESLGLELPVDGSPYVTTEAPKKAAKARSKSNTTIADTVITPRGQVDIVFVVDTTGSMGGCIDNVKNNLNAFVDDIKAAGITPNFALVEYKDIIDDGPNTTKVKPNNKNHSNWFKNAYDFKNELEKLSASGGGDIPESAIDALEMAHQLDMRDSSQKFFILITDADYKVDNNYGIESMDNLITSLKNDNINVSVVSDTGYKNTYTNLYETTGGVFADVNGNFKNELLSISDKINEETNDGYWVFLRGLTLKHAKLDAKPTYGSDNVDSDRDTLPDYKELKSCEPTIDVYFSDFMRLMYGDIVGVSFNYPTAKAYDCYSDPTLEDSDGDGLLDGTSQYYYVNKEKKPIAPVDPKPLEYTGEKNLWKTHISEIKNNTKLAYDYSDEYYKPVHLECDLKFKGFIFYFDSNLIEFLQSSFSTFGSVALDFKYDDKKLALHSDTEQWQKIGGYNDFYDWVFDHATSMNKIKLDFNYGDYNYVVWAWKGNYLNLGAGSEVGFYKQDKILQGIDKFTGLEHWMVADTLPMSLNLYKKSGGAYDSYYHWMPDEEQWWITGFVPDEYNWWFDQDSDNFIKEDQLIQIASVDFSNFGTESNDTGKNAYESIKNEYIKYNDNTHEYEIVKEHKEYKDNLIFDDEQQTLWLVS